MDTRFNRYNKTEFRIVTAIFILLVFNVINVAINGSNDIVRLINAYSQKGVGFTYMGNYLLPWLCRYAAIYAAYAVSHFVIEKKLLAKTAMLQSICLIILLFTALVVTWAETEARLQQYNSFIGFFKYANESSDIIMTLLGKSFFSVSWLMLLYASYIFLKHNATVASFFKTNNWSLIILRECLAALTIWVIVFYFVKDTLLGENYMIAWITIAFPAIPLYAYASIRLIPLVKSKGKGFWYYWQRFALIGAVVTVALVLWDTLFIQPGGQKQLLIMGIITIFVLVQLCISVPAFWFIYHYRASRNAEITGLKTALGQSSANLDFLRSQINPHFLFNALNTLYGTAIQENADRTGEGIQKLGDMMRFMLQENMQENISLMREVDYLKNYIDLQKLRTHSSPEIVIQTEIEESVNGLQIAPMLLIPFVENAFKHGISLREPSYVKITLHTEGLELFFDVHNSVHPKVGIDPEKNNNGIGLQNVKQRLQLLYPDRHELMIRETSKEFFVHLTVQV